MPRSRSERGDAETGTPTGRERTRREIPRCRPERGDAETGTPTGWGRTRRAVMPELPEVETIKGQLQKFIVGKKLAGLEVRFPRLVRPLSPSEASQKTVGAKIVTVGRHGKYLLLSLDNGQVLVIHLRLTGQLHYFASEAPPMGTRVAAIFTFTDGSSLFFTDL